MCIAYTHDRTRISFQFLFIQNIYILFENERGWDFVLYHLFILFSSICLNEAVAQLTDEQRWWRHRVRCCSNRRYVLACSQVCAWSTDLPSTCLQVIESVVRVLGIEKRPFSLLVRHHGRSSLSLKEILWLLMTVCRGWLVSSKMARSFFVVLFSATVITTIQLEADHRAGPPDELVKPGGVPLGCAASPTHHSVKKDAGDHRLIEHWQKLITDIKRSQPP